MSDRDDLIRRLNPGPPTSESEPGSSFPVDPQGIPILNDVVAPGAESKRSAGPEPIVTAEEPAPVRELDYDRLFSNLRVSLLARLSQELEQLSGDVAEQVVHRVREELEREIRQQLQPLMEQQVTAALDAELDRLLAGPASPNHSQS